VALGEEDPRIVVLDADLSGSTRTAKFGERFPDRFFNFGIAEQNMMSAAAGLASCGKIAFASTFAVFAAGRAYDQVRMSIAYPGLDVKIGASHGGLAVGEDGASHQALEDVALMRALPGMAVVVPADGPETKAVVRAAVSRGGPVYIRLGRPAVPVIFEPGVTFEFGRSRVLREGRDVAIFACGPMVHLALQAAASLSSRGVSARVVNASSISPLDEEAVSSAARECGAIVTAEDHGVVGGLGSAVCEAVAGDRPVPVERVGARAFGRSGSPESLYVAYGLDAGSIARAAESAVRRKRNGG